MIKVQRQAFKDQQVIKDKREKLVLQDLVVPQVQLEQKVRKVK